MDYVRKLHQSIEELVKQFKENPFDFLCERDLQARLFSLLVDKFKNERIEMKGGYLDIKEYGGTDTVKTVPVKCEYLQAFDIAIIDPNTLRSYDKAEWQAKEYKSDAFWNQPVLAAVELKHFGLGNNRSQKMKEECDKDIEKLRAYRDQERGKLPFLGISLLFIQSNTVNPSLFINGIEIEKEKDSGLLKYVVTSHDWLKFAV